MSKLSKLSQEKLKELFTDVVEEIQEVCLFEPPLKPKGKSVKQLASMIKEAHGELTPDDKLSVKALEVFQYLGLDEAEEASEEQAETVDVEAEEVNGDEKSVEEQIKSAKSIKQLKNIAKANKEFEDFVEQGVGGYSSVGSMRSWMLKLLSGEAKIKKPSSDSKRNPTSKKTGTSKKRTREKTELGTTVGTGASKIDDVFLGSKRKWLSKEEIAKKAGVKASRISTHVNHLNKMKRAKIDINKNGKDISYKLVKVSG